MGTIFDKNGRCKPSSHMPHKGKKWQYSPLRSPSPCVQPVPSSTMSISLFSPWILVLMTHIKNFDPNVASSADSGIFGLPFTPDEARLVLLPVPWEVTTSYGKGTARGPQAIFHASKQVDLFDGELGAFYEAGIALLEESSEVKQWNEIAGKLAQTIIAAGGVDIDPQLKQNCAAVNVYSAKLNQYVYDTVKKWLMKGKYVGVVGGDHSTPFGAVQAFLERYPHMGILHIDAHADTRASFEGFEHSHASIMYNVINKTSLDRLVQVGIRDFCQEEFEFIRYHSERIVTFFDAQLAEAKLSGQSWSMMCADIVNHLPQEVYISFDIDGLDPRFCPNTGTPVPGGLEWNEALFLIKRIVHSGRKIIGFDLNEVAPGPNDLTATGVISSAQEWDANVGARLLYKLCGWTLKNR